MIIIEGFHLLPQSGFKGSALIFAYILNRYRIAEVLP